VSSVVILGAGAVGSLFGARFSAAGEDVLLVGRPAHVEAIRAHGLTVEGTEPGTFSLEATATLPGGTRADAVLLTVKSFDLAEASAELARAVAPTPTALLGNGLGIEGTAAGALRTAGWPEPERSLVRAVHSVPATWLAPGKVRASGTGEVVFPEPTAAGAASAATASLISLFARSRFEVRTSATFDLEVWRKAVVNAAINPVTAVRRVVNGALRDGPAREEAELLLEEAVGVARRAGVDLSLATARADLERIVRATAENRSSMLQDVERGRPTEVRAISEEILRRGLGYGLELPATRRAVAEVHRTVARARRPTQR